MAAIVAGGSCKKRLRSSITEGAVPLPRPHKLSTGKRSKSIRQNDAQSAPQRPHGSTPRVDGSTDTIAASPPASTKPIEQSDVARVTQQQQGGTLSNPTDAVAASPSVAAKPIEQSDAASVSQPQESTLSKPTDAVAASASAAAKLIEQSDAASVTRQPQESTLSEPADAVAEPQPPTIEQSDAAWVTQPKQQGSGLSNPTEAVAASPAAIATLRVADANSSPPHADPEALDGGGRITERNKPTADIVRGLSSKPVQMFLLLVLGAAIVVFLISLVIILHHRVTALTDLRPKAQAQHGLQDDGARRSQMFVDDKHNQVGMNALRRIRPTATRPQNRAAISTEPPPKSSLEEVEVALEDFRAKLVYVEWDAIQNGSRQGRSG
jgi:hypothetical protein